MHDLNILPSILQCPSIPPSLVKKKIVGRLFCVPLINLYFIHLACLVQANIACTASPTPNACMVPIVAAQFFYSSNNTVPLMSYANSEGRLLKIALLFFTSRTRLQELPELLHCCSKFDVFQQEHIKLPILTCFLHIMHSHATVINTISYMYMYSLHDI